MDRSRVAVFAAHLAPAHGAEDVAAVAAAPASSAAALDPAALNEWLVRDNREMRAAIFEHLKDPIYAPNYYLSLADFRALTSRRMETFVAQRFFSVRDYLGDPLKFAAALECLSFCDYSLAIKSGVHFTLCGGTVAKLGTARHHAEILPRMDTLDLPGCFAMTELGHGSNVMGIQTTAEYDAATQEFIIHTPSNEASKFWIGGAAETAKISAVFAQLTVNGVWQGPHVFAVRLRDDAGAPARGIRIADNGPKQGLNGVDNGQIWFNRARVPRAALLDRYASVAPDGTYASPIASIAQRFGTMVSGLTTGRMLIGQAAIDACKVGVTIALRYAAARPQFGDDPVLAYVTHQRRLLPALAITYALDLSMARCKRLAAAPGGGSAADARAVHVLSSGLKAAATWHRVRVLQDCRECCGGQGFLAINKIGPMLNDMNVDVTFEGDNTVMMQQAARPLVDAAAKRGGAALAPPPPPAVNALALGPGCARKLLEWRRDALTAEIAAAAAAAGARGGAAAAAAAVDAALDRVVLLGWASVDAATHADFLEEARGAPPPLRPALERLALLYGLSRVEAGLPDLLAGGALPGAAAAPLRAAVNALCAELAERGGAAALALCDGFGVPDHLLQAPIALEGGWRRIGG